MNTFYIKKCVLLFDIRANYLPCFLFISNSVIFTIYNCFTTESDLSHFLTVFVKLKIFNIQIVLETIVFMF